MCESLMLMLVRFLYLKARNKYLLRVEALMTSIFSRLSYVVIQSDRKQKEPLFRVALLKWSSVDKVLLPRGKLTRIVKIVVLTLQR